ncbi:MAG: hypothetical protein QGH11_02010, partial [Pirellulaceae bacterium]|nr:hypothetical protein [Pirellulaceae bacterium]
DNQNLRDATSIRIPEKSEPMFFGCSMDSMSHLSCHKTKQHEAACGDQETEYVDNPHFSGFRSKKANGRFSLLQFPVYWSDAPWAKRCESNSQLLTSSPRQNMRCK